MCGWPRAGGSLPAFTSDTLGCTVSARWVASSPGLLCLTCSCLALTLAVAGSPAELLLVSSSAKPGLDRMGDSRPESGTLCHWDAGASATAGPGGILVRLFGSTRWKHESAL